METINVSLLQNLASRLDREAEVKLHRSRNALYVFVDDGNLFYDHMHGTWHRYPETPLPLEDWPSFKRKMPGHRVDFVKACKNLESEALFHGFSSVADVPIYTLCEWSGHDFKSNFWQIIAKCLLTNRTFLLNPEILNDCVTPALVKAAPALFPNDPDLVSAIKSRDLAKSGMPIYWAVAYVLSPNQIKEISPSVLLEVAKHPKTRCKKIQAQLRVGASYLDDAIRESSEGSYGGDPMDLLYGPSSDEPTSSSSTEARPEKATQGVPSEPEKPSVPSATPVLFQEEPSMPASSGETKSFLDMASDESLGINQPDSFEVPSPSTAPAAPAETFPALIEEPKVATPPLSEPSVPASSEETKSFLDIASDESLGINQPDPFGELSTPTSPTATASSDQPVEILPASTEESKATASSVEEFVAPASSDQPIEPLPTTPASSDQPIETLPASIEEPKITTPPTEELVIPIPPQEKPKVTAPSVEEFVAPAPLKEKPSVPASFGETKSFLDIASDESLGINQPDPFEGISHLPEAASSEQTPEAVWGDSGTFEWPEGPSAVQSGGDTPWGSSSIPQVQTSPPPVFAEELPAPPKEVPFCDSVDTFNQKVVAFASAYSVFSDKSVTRAVRKELSDIMTKMNMIDTFVMSQETGYTATQIRSIQYLGYRPIDTPLVAEFTFHTIFGIRLLMYSSPESFGKINDMVNGMRPPYTSSILVDNYLHTMWKPDSVLNLIDYENTAPQMFRVLREALVIFLGLDADMHTIGSRVNNPNNLAIVLSIKARLQSNDPRDRENFPMTYETISNNINLFNPP